MNILWITDFNIDHHKGGAQRSSNLTIEYGRSIGHDITEFNYDSDARLLNKEYDYVVTSNILLILKERAPWLISWLETLNNHVRWEYDSNEYLKREARLSLFNNAKYTIFLCDLHRDSFIKHYGIKQENSYVIPPPIDTSLFFDKKESREESMVWVGLFHQLKGSEYFLDFIKNNPKKKFIIVEIGDLIKQRNLELGQNVRVIKDIPYEKMPAIYNKYTDFFYAPTGVSPLFIEPFGRTIAEAVMCGMKLTVGDNIGAVQSLKKLGDKNFFNACNKASETFYRLLSR